MASKLNVLITCVLLITCFNFNAQDFLKDYQLIGNDIGKKYITWSEVMKCFKAEKEIWSNGKSVKLFLPSNRVDNYQDFYTSVYKKSYFSVKKFWILTVFQGRAREPNFYNDYNDLLRLIARSRGTIAFVPKSLKIPEEYKLNLVDDTK